MKKRNLVNYLMIVFAVTIVFSCNPSESPIEPPAIDSSIVPINTPDYTSAKTILGRGYDVSGDFCKPDYTRSAVLDQEKLFKDGKIKKDRNLEATEAETVEGTSIKEYQERFSFAVSTGSKTKLPFFSGQARANFDISNNAYNENSYASLMSFTRKYALYIEGGQTPSDLTDYVKSEFTDKVNNLDFNSPDKVNQFIKAYGTHVITSGIWGASLSYSMTAMRTKSSTAISLGSYAEANANIIILKSNVSSDIENKFKESFESSTLKKKITVKGGKSEYGLLIVKNPTNENYTKWVESIEDNSVLCSYYDNSLIPIWEFVKDQDKKDKLKKAVSDYLIGKLIDTETRTEIITLKKKFNFEGSAYFKNRYGDNSMNMRDGKKIGIYVEMNLKVADNRESVIATIEDVYFEENGINTGNTKNGFIEPQEVVLWVGNGRKILELEENVTNWVYRKNLKGGDQGGRVLIDNDCPWYWDSRVRYDGPGGKDYENSQIKGEFRVKVKVFK